MGSTLESPHRSGPQFPQFIPALWAGGPPSPIPFPYSTSSVAFASPGLF